MALVHPGRPGRQRVLRTAATLTAPVPTDGLDHYAVAMTDLEGNEFDIN
jgi:hypothetical protein